MYSGLRVEPLTMGSILCCTLLRVFVLRLVTENGEKTLAGLLSQELGLSTPKPLYTQSFLIILKMVASQYHSQYPLATGPARNHYHYQQAPSGKKYAVPFHQSALKDGSLLTQVHGGFLAFRHSLSGKGKSKISYEPYDVQVTCENSNSNESIGIAFKEPTPSLKHSEHDGFVAGSSRSSPSQFYLAGIRLIRTVLAQIRVDPAIMHTPIANSSTDPRAISRALAISLERVGVLITIVSADENTNSYPSRNLLARSVMNQKLDAIAPADLQYWSKLFAANDYEYDYGGYVPPMTPDSVLFINTSNNGSVDLLYTYPNSQSR
ncbi:hypothetical protein DFH05DRAFT_1456251 [Lentinula detonsa]|uniref:Uncharacterized protein n=1 Tax=Lentinula detonsa TaxID=2804962 RepID=A0A9W8PCN6_9AGAR|nr:hypothetical protein DFH05DRAFT_1456251 [Lentinula detonsa]